MGSTLNQLKAILLRRWLMTIRTWKSTSSAIIIALVASLLAIIVNYLMVIILKPNPEKLNFSQFRGKPTALFFFKSNGTQFENFEELKEIMINDFKNETERDCINFTIDSPNEMNSFVWDYQKEWRTPAYVPLAVGFPYESNSFPMLGGLGTHVFYNTSGFFEASEEYMASFFAFRTLWKYFFNKTNDLKISITEMATRNVERMFGMIGPIIIGAGIVACVPLFINQPIIDITGEIRSYMQSCTLKVFPYWAATFIVDYGIWLVIITVMFAIYCAAQIQAFLDNPLTVWYTFALGGPSYILCIYCLSFCFDSISSAGRQMFLFFVLLLLVPFVVEMIRWKPNPIWVEWIYSLIPHLGMERLMAESFQKLGPLKENFSYYWTYEHTEMHLIMQLVDIVIYATILTIIEAVRDFVSQKRAKASFGSYSDFFKDNETQETTPEAIAMAESVKDCHDFAVRIENVSRLFFNTEGKPIPAVNNVSLGVKQGSLFGFLGANGAGKTTLIRMITSMLPPSHGSIEINGTDISVHHDPTAIAICPQFNKHLIYEMTPAEHFKLYGLLFDIPDDEAKERADKLINDLELSDIKDKVLSDLSQGDARKLAIALCFFGPAKIILLDEPTASLDPVARHNVQEMISQNRGDKTFMLCTHLLSEAENLCDIISIMVKGRLYTCGTPAALTEKFGTDYKIDVMLADESDETGEKCDRFVLSNIPSAELNISRPKARIYDVSAKAIELHELFEKMEEGINGDNGIVYYTCSSSSLERVFMEIVKMSETGEDNP